MNFNIAIARVATFLRPELCKNTPVEFPQGDALRAKFRDQAAAIVIHDDFRQAKRNIETHIKGVDPTYESHPCVRQGSPDGIGEIKIQKISEELAEFGITLEASEALVARLPSERYHMTIGDTRWILRTRAALTSCALEGNSRPTKLWWTFEGIPADDPKAPRPGEEAVAQLVDMGVALEERAREGLKEAFAKTLQAAVGAKGNLKEETGRLRIAVTESVDRDADALLDALYIDDKQVVDIADPYNDDLQDARTGLNVFSKFVRHVVGANVPMNDNAIFVPPREVPGFKGVFYRCERADTKAVAGFTRRVGAQLGYGLLTRRQRDAQRQELQVRMRCAARPLSALLSTTEASGFGGAQPG